MILRRAAVFVFVVGWSLDIASTFVALSAGFIETNAFWAARMPFVFLVPVAGFFMLFVPEKFERWLSPIYGVMAIIGILHLAAGLHNFALVFG